MGPQQQTCRQQTHCCGPGMQEISIVAQRAAADIGRK